MNNITETIRKEFRPVLKDIHPGGDFKEKIIPLKGYPIFSKYIKNDSVLIIGFGKLSIEQIGLFCCKKQTNDFIKFIIILNDKFQKHYNIKAYPMIKKYCIVHEFCHFISIIVNFQSKLSNTIADKVE